MNEFWLALLALTVWLLPMLLVVWVLARGERRKRHGRMPPRC